MKRAIVVLAMLWAAGCGDSGTACPEDGHVIVNSESDGVHLYYFDCASPSVYLGTCLIEQNNPVTCSDAMGVEQPDPAAANATWRAACAATCR